MRVRAAAAVTALITLVGPLCAQTRVEYIGGTARVLKNGTDGHIDLTDDRYLAFYGDDSQMRIAYDQINLVEYGQQVDRRLMLALLISPVFLLSKARKHYLTVGFEDDRGAQQALVFRVDKDNIRAALAALEARTGLKVSYTDQEARKAGN